VIAMRTYPSLGFSSIASLCFLFLLGVSARGQQSFRPQGSEELSVGDRAGAANRLDSSAQSRSGSRPQRSSSSRATYVRVARAPNMFGDTLTPQVTFLTSRGPGQATEPIAAFTAPLGGGGSYNIAENNTSVPTDRVYFVYNGFFNAASNTVAFGPNGPIQQSVDLHRYLVGFEKTFLDGNASLDVRMPFINGLEFQGFGISSDGGNVGNMTMYLKGMLYADDSSAFATGLGLGLPTGSDFDVNFPAAGPAGGLTIRNETVTLMPFVASTMSLNDRWFLQSFGQVLFVAAGDTVVRNNQEVGVYTQQNLIQTDIGLGRWLWRDSNRSLFSGLAGVFELHYTSTIQDSDVLALPPGGPLGGQLSNEVNRLDLLNLTSGIHAQLGPMSSLRVGAIVPLRQAPDRVFDSEIQVSFNRKF
jgi:hypothetical protein